MKIPINPKNQYKKGEMLINAAGWPSIVMEATRGNNPTIIPIVEIYGFEHECGSCYTNEITSRLTREEFELAKRNLGHGDANQYFKGELIEPIN